MTSPYREKDYWDSRYRERGTDPVGSGSGTFVLGNRLNQYQYRLRLQALDLFLKDYQIEPLQLEVLDLGCGSGFWTDVFLGKGVAGYHGVDVAETAIASLQARHAEVPFECRDLGEAFDLEKRFDLVNVFDVLYHITDDAKFETALGNVARHLKPEGWALLVDYFDDRQTDTAAHVKHRSLDFYDRTLAKQGLVRDRVYPVLYTSARVVGLFRKDINNGWLMNYFLAACYLGGVFSFIPYWIDRYKLPRIDPLDGGAKTKMMVVRRTS